TRRRVRGRVEHVRAARELQAQERGARRVVHQARPGTPRGRAHRRDPAERDRRPRCLRGRRRRPLHRDGRCAVRPRPARGADRRARVTPGSPRLLPPGARPGFVGTLSVPGDLWWVCTEPTPLAGMAYPRRGAWDILAELGFHHVVDLTRDAAKYDPAPLTSHASKLADLVV